MLVYSKTHYNLQNHREHADCYIDHPRVSFIQFVFKFSQRMNYKIVQFIIIPNNGSKINPSLQTVTVYLVLSGSTLVRFPKQKAEYSTRHMF